MRFKEKTLDIDEIKKSFFHLKKYCEENDFCGFDPYDGLSSRFFEKIPFLSKNKWIKLCWIQFHKKSPFNFRKFFLIEPVVNPKSLGIFLRAYCKLYKLYKRETDLAIINKLIQDIFSHRCHDYSEYCWGYPFDWQSFAFYHPKNTPTVVSSSFVALSLLDAYDIVKNQELLEAAKSTSEFIKNDLNRKYDSNNNFAVSYSPLDSTFVYNASFLASHLFSRLFLITNNIEYKEMAKRIIVYCCKKQQPNGSWFYGEAAHHQWIDSFHTGYNIECLYAYQSNCEDLSFNNNLEIGLEFYLKNLFTKEGYSKYFSNVLYPIDIHSSSQLIITLSRLNKLDRYKVISSRVLHWTIHNMQASEGYFYYQKKRFFTNKISYMRWTQSWMLYALVSYIENEEMRKIKSKRNYEKLFKSNQFLANTN